MKFSKEQVEGLARFFDTIAASAFIGAVVGHSGHSTLTGVEVAFLYAACPVILVFSFWLRRPK